MAGPPTPFEASGYTTTTTFAEGETFIDDVVSGSGRVTKILIGRSFEGRPIHAVVVGGTSAPPLASGQDGLVCICSQHGQEGTPREAGLAAMRDLAYEADPAVVSELDARPIVIVPTANPDGTIANDRYNGNGDDINRSHSNLSAPEARAIRKLLRAVSPVFLYDGHHWGGAVSDVNLLFHGSGAPVPIVEQEQQFYTDVASWFPDYTYTRYTESEVHEGKLMNVATFGGTPYVLVESRSALPAMDGYTIHLRIIKNLYQYVADNHAGLLAVRSSAHRATIDEGLTAHSFTYLYESGWPPPALGYFVEPSAHALLDAQGLTYYPNADHLMRTYVPVAQPSGGVIPPMIDPRGPRPAVVAEAVYEGTGYGGAAQLPWYTPENYIVNLSGTPQQARRVVFDGKIIWGV